MFHKTKGILLRKTKLSNGGYMLKYFTENFGIKTYFGRISKKEKNAYLPLSIANITAYDQPKKTIHTIKDYELFSPLRSVYQDIYKSNVLIFINEVLNYIIQEEEANKEKYQFLEYMIIQLEKEPFNSNFHLLFLMKLTSFIGIEPNLDSDRHYFDMEEGDLTNTIPIHSNFFDSDETVLFKTIYQNSIENKSSFKLTNTQRKRTLQLLVTYYRYHTDMRELKSLPVLEMVFN